jgi:hypothetical protein
MPLTLWRISIRRRTIELILTLGLIEVSGILRIEIIWRRAPLIVWHRRPPLIISVCWLPQRRRALHHISSLRRHCCSSVWWPHRRLGGHGLRASCHGWIGTKYVRKGGVPGSSGGRWACIVPPLLVAVVSHKGSVLARQIDVVFVAYAPLITLPTVCCVIHKIGGSGAGREWRKLLRLSATIARQPRSSVVLLAAEGVYQRNDGEYRSSKRL